MLALALDWMPDLRRLAILERRAALRASSKAL